MQRCWAFRNTAFWPHLPPSGPLHLPAAPFVCQWAPLCVGVPVVPLCPCGPVRVPVAHLCVVCRWPPLCTLVTSFACLVADGCLFRPCPQARGNKPQDLWLFAVFHFYLQSMPRPSASRTCRRVSFSSSFSVTLFSRCSIDTFSCAHASISLIVSTSVV